MMHRKGDADDDAKAEPDDKKGERIAPQTCRPAYDCLAE